MPADRFYIPVDLKPETSVFLEGPEHHHLVNVMRLSKGEEVELVNGRGDLAFGMIVAVNKKNAEVAISSASHEPDPHPYFILAAPLMRASKLEWVIEKGTELGASSFLIYQAKFSEKEELSPRHMERLHLLAISALKQSGRLHLPGIEIVSGLSSLFAKEAVFLFGDPRADKTLTASHGNPATTVFITGPEKGFSSEELSLLEERAKGVRLSPYILRAETAPLAAASILGTSRIAFKK